MSVCPISESHKFKLRLGWETDNIIRFTLTNHRFHFIRREGQEIVTEDDRRDVKEQVMGVKKLDKKMQCNKI